MDIVPAVIDLDAMFPGLQHQRMRFVLHVCGLRDLPSQTRLIEFEGLETVEDLANYTDAELDAMADRNSKRSPAPTRVQMGLARTKKLKAIKFWVVKKLREMSPLDLNELNDATVARLIREMAVAKAGAKDSDSKLYYPESFVANDYKNWIKKVSNYLDSRKGKAGVPLSYIIRPVDADPDKATDEYTRVLWAASFETEEFMEDNREVYHLFKDLSTKTDGATWFEKVTDGDGRSAHLLLREHYIGEAHDMRRAAAATAKLEALFWKSEASFPFEKYLTRMNEAFKELEDADQPMYVQQKVHFLLKSMRCDDIQVQTTMGIVRDKYSHDFEGACMALSRTISSRFALAEPGKSSKRSIGAATTTNKSARGSGRGGGRSGNRGGRGSTGKAKVIMNGVDVSDINRSFTTEEWEKLRTCGGIAYIHQRREYLANRGSGRFDGRGGGYSGRGSGRGYADRGTYGGRSGGRYATDNRQTDQTRAIAATSANNTTTEIVEYDADAPNAAPARAPAVSFSDRGGRAGARFGPRRDY